PGLVAKAVLIEPTIRQRNGAAYPEGNPLVERTRNRRARWPGRAAMTEALGQRTPYKSWEPEMLHLFAEHATAQLEGGEVELLCGQAIEAALCASFRDYGPWTY